MVTYDAANRLKSFTHSGSSTASSLNQTFSYDDLDRITGYTSSTASLGYGYDQNGNRNQYRVGASTFTNSVAPSSNRLTGTSGPLLPTSHGYDAAGNILSAGALTFVYGDRRRLVSSIKDGVTTNYLYNGVGQRVLKSGTAVRGGATSFAYDEDGHTVGEYTDALETFQETVFFGDTPVAVVTDGNTYNIYSDHLNTPRLVSNSVDNSIVWRWDSADPFGADAPIEISTASGNPFRYNMRFPGQTFDGETGLHYNYFRDYDPQTGRYLQSDPIGLEGGINTYLYVGGNPLSWTDPSGLIKIPGIPGAVGETSVHANPGPDATTYRPEHGPGHVHLGQNDGPRVTTDTFEPMSAEDAKKMTRKQKKFCEGLGDAAKDKIRKAQRSIFKHGTQIIAISGGGLSSIAAACRNDPLWCAEQIESGVLP